MNRYLVNLRVREKTVFYGSGFGFSKRYCFLVAGKPHCLAANYFS